MTVYEMATAKPTPEEKLFAVIQGAHAIPIRGRSQPFSLARLREMATKLLRACDVPRINQGLLVLMFGLGAWCLLAPVLMHPSVERIIKQTSQYPAPFVTPPLSGLRPVEEYVESMAQHDPFRVGERPVQSATGTTATPPDPRALVADLKLVGIAFSDQPVAMVEEHEQTHVLKVGDTLRQMTVKEIFKDRVVFQIDDQDIPLF